MGHNNTFYPLKEDLDALYEQMRNEYIIGEEHYKDHNVKRGLRNEDGTGVIAGVTKIGSVQGYIVKDGERTPIPGKLYYRGIDVEDIINAHKEQNSFGFEEVAYLLLMGKLPNAEEYELFDLVLSKARALPQGFLRT
jgi:citrate synthase